MRATTFPIQRFLGLAGAAWLCNVTGRAQLSAVSPFLAPTAGAVSREEPSGLELRGVAADREGSEYCIYDAAKKRSTWQALHEVGPACTVLSGASDGTSVTVSAGGRVLTLRLHEAKVVVSTLAAAPLPEPAAIATALASPSIPTAAMVAEQQKRALANALLAKQRREMRALGMRPDNYGPRGANASGAP